MKTGILATGMALMGAFALALPAQAEKIEGNGKVITKEIRVNDYSGVSMGGLHNDGGSFSFTDLFKARTYVSPTFNYKQGNESVIRITTDENILPHLDVKVDGGVLRICTEDDETLLPTKFVIDGTSQTLETVRISGGGNFYLKSPLKSETLKMRISGGGDLYLNEPANVTNCAIRVSGGGDMEGSQLSCDQITIDVSGGGDVKLGGKAGEGELRVSGGGDVHAYDMTFDELSFRISGGGSARVHVLQKLDGHVSGGGDLYYKGKPNAETSTSGGGDVHKVND